MIYETNFKKLLKIFPNLLSMKLEETKKLTSEGFMDLVLQVIDETETHLIVSLTHYFEQNGDLVTDPEMTLKVSKNFNTVEALTFEMGGITYREVYPIVKGEAGINRREKKEQNSFLRTWLINIKRQF